VPLLVAFGKNSDARFQVGFGVLVLAIVAGMELSSTRWPMAAHWRAWVTRGPALRRLGYFALPGWQSALAFTALAAVPAACCFLVPGFSSIGTNPAWLVFLAVVGLVFPAVVLSFFNLRGKSPAALYFLVLGASNLVAALAYVLHNLPDRVHGALPFAAILPGAGFWVSSNTPSTINPTVFVFQCAVALVILGAAVWRSRAYWRHVAQIDARVRASPQA
jgi:hypothetical protein